MTPAVTVAGWAAASVALLGALLLRRSLASRMETVARACHELRGPITAARLGLELGARPGALSAERLRALDLELGRAELAIDDLASARTRRRTPPRVWEDVELRSLLTDSVEAWRPLADAKGVALSLEWDGGPAFTFADRIRLAQATGNLIANAIEHGAGPVIVRVSVPSPWREDLIRIEFIDRGPGLPAPAALLTRHAHGGRGTRGRGLAIAIEVAVSHGGRLAAAPSDCGARLLLELPLARGVGVGA